jgi:hypothetical protein
MREKANKLKASKFTRPEGNDLLEYVARLQAAHELKSANDIETWTIAELEHRVALVADEVVGHWPHDVCVRILERHNKMATQHKKWTQLVNNCKPWVENQDLMKWNPHSPRLCDITWKSRSYREQYCSQWLCGNLLRNAILDGEPGSATVMEIATAVVKEYDTVDWFSVATDEVKFLKELLGAMKGLVALLQVPLDLQMVECVEELRAVEGQRGDSCRHKVFSAIKADEFWWRAMNQFDAAAPTIREFSDDVCAYLEKAEDAEIDNDFEEVGTELVRMLDACGALMKTVPERSIEKFASQLKSGCMKFHSQVKHAVEVGRLERLPDMYDKVMSEMQLVFSIDNQVSEVGEAANQLRMDMTAMKRRLAFLSSVADSVGALTGASEELVASTLNRCDANAQDVRGLKFTKEEEGTIMELVYVSAKYIEVIGFKAKVACVYSTARHLAQEFCTADAEQVKWVSFFDCIAGAVELSPLFDRMKGALAKDNDHHLAFRAVLMKLVSVTAEFQKLTELEKNADSETMDTTSAAFMKLVTEAKVFDESLHKNSVATAEANLKEKVDNLKAISGGGKGGASWHEHITTKSFDTCLKQSKEFVEMDFKALNELVKATEESLVENEKVRNMAGLDASLELNDSARSHINRGKHSHFAQELLKALTSTEKKDTLRRTRISELTRELRKVGAPGGTKEKEVLPRAMFDKLVSVAKGG